MVKKLLFLNGIAIVAVVLSHSILLAANAPIFWEDLIRDHFPPGYQAMTPFLNGLFETIFFIDSFCVPVFVFTSGFFVSYSVRNQSRAALFNIYLKRIGVMLIPYVLWSLVVIGFNTFFDNGNGFFKDLPTILYGGATDAYYYIFVIIQLYLLAPFIAGWVIKKPGLMILVGFGLKIGFEIFLMVNQAIHITTYYVLIRLFPSLLLYFILGIVFGSNIKRVEKFTIQYRWVNFGLIFLSILGSFLERYTYWTVLSIDKGWYPMPISTIVYSFAFICFAMGFPNENLSKSRGLNSLGKSVYAIFLIHPIAILVTSKIIYHAAPALIGLPYIFVLILATMGVILPVILIRLVNRSPLRKYTAYIFG